MGADADPSGTEFVFDRYAQIREGFYHRDLSRGFDERSFEEGNPRADILSVLHGSEHKERRKMENPLFRREALIEYERELFPRVVDEVMATQETGRTDLFRLGGALSVVLAARRAGVDHDGTMAQLGQLWDHVLMIAQASAILDVVGDKDRVQAEVSEVLRRFGEEYVTPSRRRRERLLDAHGRGEGVEVPDDLITRVIEHRRSGTPPELDEGTLVREAGLYLHGGSHTSAQTTCNTFYYLLGLGTGSGPHPALRRVAQDPFWAQRAVHETLRLRPTTPRIKRLAVADVTIDGIDIPAGSTVVFDVRAANRAPELYGDDPDAFDPDRTLADGMALWGLSFGAGPHICIGRSVAGGFPLQERELRGGVGDQHLYGLVALIVRAVAACEVSASPDDPPELDTRTDRGTRWARFPIELARHPSSVPLVTRG